MKRRFVSVYIEAAKRLVVSVLIVASVGGPPLQAQPDSLGAPPAGPRRVIPVRQLTDIRASDTTVLMGVSAVRHLPNGSVIVNDAVRRQLVVFDSTLAKFRIIADTSTSSPNSYGLRGAIGALVPYVGDSSLFVDTESQALLVIDEHGNFARVMAPTRPFDLNYIASGAFGFAGFDPQGRMVYRTMRRNPPQPFNPNATTGGKPVITALPDSAPLMRSDFDKRTVDTIGMIKIALQKQAFLSFQGGNIAYNVVNPLPGGDEWTLMPDGTIAIVRVQDYHIDWLAPEGTLTSSPRMPFDWKRLTLEDKQQLIDSVRKAAAEREAKLPPPPPPVPGQPAFPRMPFVTIEPNELPDYYPPVRANQVRADPQNQVWILPSTSADAKGGLLYDVVNRQGEIVERVQLPQGRTLVGFGANGSIYMHNVISPTRASLERARVQR